ncbi:uncharacterized protein VTP21DRAFT_5874 [Calcarisporiella thermophila]|uniref:uncharacterized protein n=1 Tax=Calcarisporiella thermophila TaxID=911321 RepID=UPI003742EAD6
MPPTPSDNIQVVVRCRGRSEREIREGSREVVITSAVRGREVTLRSNPLDVASSKTYTFDGVFGPEADQEVIFNDVVAPILEEVMKGYNCTIFAYGQTSTGKTYTMEGDLDIVDSQLSSSAGIVPRALQSLFNTLEAEQADYLVRASFIELYNEEMKDLLSPDDDARKLRLFEDPTKKDRGVHIQGLEEVHLKNAEQGIQYLKQGSHRRRIAATKCNDKSSRSHSVFTLTINIKETTAAGEDLLKIGKLNLVDLAGSENISRSGAENIRAREAGMINTSLLTLGRVINALVENSSHVPYRESKLTRLLQDSLGGRTKTCIIATISPAKMNLEETESTLKYASRAKNIKNKPEVNQRMTTKLLLKEYENEIERLQKDLLAAREKHGVYLSQESYQAFVEEKESRNHQFEEMKHSIETLQNTLKHAEHKYQQKMRALAETQAELNGIRVELSDSRRALESMKQEVQEQRILRQVHEKTESKLNTLATGLVSKLSDSVSDVNGLHEKINRKDLIEMDNRRVFENFRETLLQSMFQVHSILTEFHSIMGQQSSGFENKLEEFQKSQKSSLTKTQSQLEHQLNKLKDELARNQSISVEQQTGRDQLVKMIEAVTEGLKQDLSTQRQRTESISAEVLAEIHEAMYHASQRVMLRCNELESTLKGAEERLAALEACQNQTRDASNMFTEEILEQVLPGIENQTRSIPQIVEHKFQRSSQAAEKLLKNIGAMLGEFMDDQRREVLTAVQEVDHALRERGTQFRSKVQEHRETIQKLSENQKAEALAVYQQLRLMSDHRTELGHRAEEDSKAMLNLVEGARARIMKEIDAHSQHLASKHTQYNSIASQYSTASQAVEAKLEAYAPVLHRAQAIWETSKARAESDQSVTSKLVDYVRHMTTTSSKQREAYLERACNELKHARDEAENLVSKRLKVDVTTGKTPRPRSYKYPRRWQVSNNDEILEEWRARGKVRLHFLSDEEDEYITGSDENSPLTEIKSSQENNEGRVLADMSNGRLAPTNNRLSPLEKMQALSPSTLITKRKVVSPSSPPSITPQATEPSIPQLPSQPVLMDAIQDIQKTSQIPRPPRRSKRTRA